MKKNAQSVTQNCNARHSRMVEVWEKFELSSDAFIHFASDETVIFLNSSRFSNGSHYICRYRSSTRQFGGMFKNFFLDIWGNAKLFEMLRVWSSHFEELGFFLSSHLGNLWKRFDKIPFYRKQSNFLFSRYSLGNEGTGLIPYSREIGQPCSNYWLVEGPRRKNLWGKMK